MDDIARYLGALYRVDNGSTISAIKYNGKEYKWNSQSTKKGSNWVEKNADIKNTLLSAIVKDLKEVSLEDMSKNSLKLTLVGKDGKEVSMSMTLKQEFAVEANGKKFGTLEEAIGESGEVKLLKNIVVTKTIPLLKNGATLIDLNGKTLTSNFEVNKLN